jgi:lysyl-tRNA synthetase class 2
MPSTVIRSFRYLADRRKLEVTFRSGRVYAYLDVPLGTAKAMRAASSKGEFFNAHVRDVFAFERRDAASRAQSALAWGSSS